MLLVFTTYESECHKSKFKINQFQVKLILTSSMYEEIKVLKWAKFREEIYQNNFLSLKSFNQLNNCGSKRHSNTVFEL